MTLTIFVDTDVLSATNLANNVEAANRHLVYWAPKWGITAVATTDPKIPADIVAHITNKFRHKGAYGYHTVETGIVRTYNVDGSRSLVATMNHLPTDGTPTAYISPATLLNKIYGYYAPATYSRAFTILGKVVRPSKLRNSARYREGVVTVLVHELMEILIDQNIDKFSAPDKLQQRWLIEVADHVSGYLSIDRFAGLTCVIPAGTFPNYYLLDSQGEWDSTASTVSPFDTTSPSFYGFAVDSKGVQIPIVKGSIHH